jgi:hypothetical protein
MAIWCILWPFGIFLWSFWYSFPVLISWTKKNLATLRSAFAWMYYTLHTGRSRQSSGSFLYCDSLSTRPERDTNCRNFDFLKNSILNPGANPTTSEFTTTTPG